MGKDASELAPLQLLQNVVRDRITQLVHREHTALYLYGRPGTGKTHLVRSWLQELNADHLFFDGGYLTAQALFNAFAEHPESIIVLDDVAALFHDVKARQYLLAAMGRQSRSGGVRHIHYNKFDEERTVAFSGGIIAISNIELTRDPRHQALASRSRPLQFDPTDEQIAALMKEIVGKGWTSISGETLTARECAAVMAHLLAESKRSEVRLDLRLLLDHALPDFLSWKSKRLLTDWKDLVTVALQHRPSEFAYTAKRSRAEHQAELHDLVTAIEKRPGTVEEHAVEFEDQTGKSRRTYFRQRKKAKEQEPEAFEGFPRIAT